MAQKLNLILLWHMHQPSYCIDQEPHLLPWTRLHATKDYLGMVTLASRIPNLRLNFNFSGVLWEQLEGYAAGHIDQELEVCRYPTDTLSIDQKNRFLRKAFSGQERTLIQPFKRYHDLFIRFGSKSSISGREEGSNLDTSELRDLMVWRILAWIYPEIRERDEIFRKAVEKEHGFTEEEKLQIIDTSLSWIARIPALYRDLSVAGKAEISATPYYHPILPILIDPDSAREALPRITMPTHFDFQADAAWHIRSAREKHKSIFGQYPKGMWPAEGSVSSKTVRLFAENKISWIASDEDILAKSAGIPFVRDKSGQTNVPELLYRPWKVETDKGKVTVLFRDHLMSDLIGFDYQNWDEDLAVMDFEQRLVMIHERTENLPFAPCVTIILDGENAWEHYRGGGWTFLEKLFTRISTNARFQTRCISEYLKSCDHQISPIPSIASGSWINGNFGIWIGHEEENTAWEYLRQASDTIDRRKDCTTSQIATARNRIRKAQASDWFWWYGDDHTSDEKEEFDFLFRTLLQQTYQDLGETVPSELHQSILRQKSRCFKLIHPKTLLSPKIDGRRDSYFEWFGAGKINFRQTFGTMHAAESEKVVESLEFGFDLQKVYLRLNPGEGIDPACEKGLKIGIRSVIPVPGTETVIELRSEREGDCARRSAVVLGEDHLHGKIHAAFEDVFEIGIPFEYLGAKRDQRVDMFVELRVGERYLGRIPDLYGIEFRVPTEDYDNLMWEV